LIADVAGKVTLQRDGITADIERQDAVGEATRARVGKVAYELDVDQQCCGGLNFGYYYDRSPIIAYDGEPQPAYTMGTFTSSSVPGCRSPHLWLEGRRSLYDALGPDYTLLRFDPRTHVTGIVEAGARRNVPLRVLDVQVPEVPQFYGHKLVLVRPDQHVAWRGNAEPDAPDDLIDLVRGARSTFVARSNVATTTR
jgi:hypothetical protein